LSAKEAAALYDAAEGTVAEEAKANQVLSAELDAHKFPPRRAVTASPLIDRERGALLKKRVGALAYHSTGIDARAAMYPEYVGFVASAGKFGAVA